MANWISWLEEDTLQDTSSNSRVLVPRKERTGCWGRSQEGGAGLHQAAQPQPGCSTQPLPAAGQGGQEAETSPALTGLQPATHCVQSLHTAKKPQLMHTAGPSKMPTHKCIPSEAWKLQGSCNYRISTPSWEKVLPQQPWPLSSSQRVSTHPFPICQRSCSQRALWLHSLVFHPPWPFPEGKTKHT